MTYKELRTEKQYLKKLAADLTGRFGDSLDAIAYSWMVFILTGSAALTAVTFAVNTLVSVLLSPFSASLITNWNKKAVMVTCDIGRSVMVTATAALFFFSVLQPWMVILVTALNSTLESFRNPAGTSIFPQIVSKEKYALAISLSGALSRGVELVGMALAGLLINVLGIAGVLWLDAGMFLLCAVILSTLKLPPHAKQTAENTFAAFVRNTREGFAYTKSNKIALAICGVACMLNFSFAPLSALQAAYVNDSLKLGAEGLSVLGVSMTLGMGLGSILVPKLLTRVRRFTLLFIGFVFTSGTFLCLVFLPLLSSWWLWTALAAVFAVMGLASAFANTVVQVTFMERIEQEYLARVSGIMSSACLAAMPVASFMCAALAKWLAVPYIFLVFASISILGTVATLFVKPLRGI